MRNKNTYLEYKSIKSIRLPLFLQLRILSMDMISYRDFLNDVVCRLDNMDIGDWRWENIKIFRLDSDLSRTFISDSIRIEIDEIYYGKFLLSDTPFTDRKSGKENFSGVLLSMILGSDGTLGFSEFKEKVMKNMAIQNKTVYKDEEKSQYSLFRKRKEALSTILKDIFMIKEDPFKYDRKNRVYRAKFQVGITNEEIAKERDKKDYMKKRAEENLWRKSEKLNFDENHEESLYNEEY